LADCRWRNGHLGCRSTAKVVSAMHASVTPPARVLRYGLRSEHAEDYDGYGLHCAASNDVGQDFSGAGSSSELGIRRVS
jgi:hypothetical protein